MIEKSDSYQVWFALQESAEAMNYVSLSKMSMGFLGSSGRTSNHRKKRDGDGLKHMLQQGIVLGSVRQLSSVMQPCDVSVEIHYR